MPTTMRQKLLVEIYRTRKELEQAAAASILRAMRMATGERDTFALVLSGGKTPREVYELLGRESVRQELDWNGAHIFFADERAVPPEDPQSNFGMIDRVFLSHISIPRENVHRIRGELDPASAADAYERELRTVFRQHSVIFDLVLLGLGEDGHTASLFPGTGVVKEQDFMVRAVLVPRLSSWRITLTLPALNSARETMFLVAGKKKATMVQRALSADSPDNEIPATCVKPVGKKIRWMLDENAAMMIKTTPGLTVERQK